MSITEINVLLEKIIENRYEDRKAQRQMCEELYSLAQEKNDEVLMGKALFYKGEAIYLEDPNEAEESLKRAIEILEKGTEYEVVARAYNMLGIIVNNRDNYSLSLEYFLNCEQVCAEHDLKYIDGMCSSNIGVIFQFLEAYDQAIPFLQKGIECFSDESSYAYSKENAVSITANLFVCYAKLKDFDNVFKCLDLMRENEQYIEPHFVFPLFESLFYAFTGKQKLRAESITAAVEEALKIDNVSQDIDSFENLCDFLYEQREYELLMRVIDFLDEVLDPDSFPKLKIKLIKYRLEYIEKDNDYQEYVRWSKEYVRIYGLVSNNYHQSILDSAMLRLDVKKHKAAEAEFKLKARIDNLTNVLNRAGFHHYAEKIFFRAITSKQPIGAFIIDIDYFKQINDGYGHSYGDECLKQVANVLLQFKSNECAVGRYGGDEFVILRYGMDASSIEEMARTIKADVEALGLEAKDSRVSDILTLSQGVYWGIPDENDTIMTFMETADQALYEVKKNNRDGYKVRTK